MSPRKIRKAYKSSLKRQVEGEEGVVTRRVTVKRKGLKRGLRGTPKVSVRDASTSDPFHRNHRHGGKMELRPGRDLEKVLKVMKRRWKGQPDKRRKKAG